MSNIVDSRVVELEFQNSQFESNAARSLSTLEKLKRALNLSDAPKGFDEINSSVRRVNVGNLTRGVQGLSGQFSALEVIAKRALENITDSAYRMTTQFVKSVSIDQVSAGWEKYADKTAAVQTIMAATAKDFSDTETQMEYVNAQLEKLNWFTDETSYSFLDMVNNIGKFTSNNIALDKAVTSMEGISTWAAISGANVNEAGRAMYNLSQAISVGSVKLMDWKSIENANMATASFKQTAIETAEALGTLTKVSDGVWKTRQGHEVTIEKFNQYLSDAWFTSDALLGTLDKYGKFTDELYNFMTKVDESVTTSTVLDYLNDFADGTIDWQAASKDLGLSVVELKTELGGLSGEALQLGKDAFKAAQEAKTFQEAVDSVKDAVSTGWMNTYEILFGDYTHAKVLWTDLANDLYDIFAEGGNVRNELLSEAFETTSAISSEEWQKLEKAGIANPEFIKRLREVTAANGVAVREMGSDQEWLAKILERGALKYSDLLDAYEKTFGSDLIDADLKAKVEGLKDTDKSFSSLLETISKYSGDDLSHVIFGNGQYEDGYKELESALDQMLSKLGLNQDASEQLVSVLKALGYFGGETANEFDKMTDAQLRRIGLTEDEIASIRSENVSLEDRKQILDDMAKDHMTGSELWTQSLYNSMGIIIGLIDAVKEAWGNIFPEASSDTIFKFAQDLYNVTYAIRDFVESNEQFRTILTGIFAAFDVGYRVVRTLAKAGFEVLKSSLEGFGTNILEIGTNVSNLVIQFREWLINNQILEKTVAAVGSVAKSASATVRGWLDSFVKMPIVQKNLIRFKYAFKSTLKQLPAYMDGAKEHVDSFMKKVDEMGGIKPENFGKILQAFKEDILDYFLEFPGFKRFGAAFNLLWEDIKTALKGIGIDLDGVNFSLTDVLNTLGSFGSGAIKGITFVAEQLKSLFTSIINIPKVQENLNRFKAGFSKAFASLPDFFNGAGERLSAFMDRVRAMDGLTIDNIGDVFADFKKNVLGYFANFEGFQGLKDAFSGAFEDIKGVLADFGIDVDGIKEKIAAFSESISTFIDSVKTSFEGFKFPTSLEEFLNLFKKGKEGVGEQAVESGEKVKTFGEFLIEVLTKLKEVLAEIDITPLIALLTAWVGYKSLKQLGDILGANTRLIQAQTSELKSRRVVEFAAAIAILALSLKLLSDIPVAKLAKAGVAIVAIGIGLYVFSRALNKMPNLKNMKGLASGLLGISAAILIIVGALKLMEYLDQEKLTGNFLWLLTIMGTLLGVAFLMSKIGKVSMGTGVGLLGLSMSLLMLVGLFKILEFVNFDKLKEQMPKFLFLLGMLALAMLSTKALGKHAQGAAASIAAIGAAFLMLSIALHILSGIKRDKLKPALEAMVVVGAVLSLLMIASSKMKGATGTVIALGVLVALLTACLAALSFIPEENLENVTNSLSKILGMLTLLGVGSGLANMVAGGKSSKVGVTLAALIILVADIGFVVYSLADLESKTGTVIPVMDKLIEIFEKLNKMLGIVVIGGIFGVGADAALAKLALTIVILGAVLIALGYASEKFPEVQPRAEQLLNEGLPFLEMIVKAIGHLIGVFIGAIVGGSLTTFTEYLPSLVVSLTTFVENLVPLCEAVQKVPDTDFSNVTKLAGVITKISWSGLVAAIANAGVESRRGKSAAEAFADDVEDLANAIKSWSDVMKDVDPESVPTTVIEDLVSAIDGIAFVELASSIADKIAGWDEQDGSVAMTRFTLQIIKLAFGLKAWSTAMSGVDVADVPNDTIDDLVAAVDSINLVGLGSAIAEKIAGWDEQDGTGAMDAFTENIGNLSIALLKWKIMMEYIGDNVTVPTETINALVDAVEAIPGTGGLFDAINSFVNGAPDLEQFKSDVGTLGEAINAYVNTLNTDVDLRKATLLTEVATSLANIVSAMTLYDYGVFKQFGSAITGELAPALQEFAKTEINTENLHSLSSSANLIATAAAKFKEVKLNGTDMLNTTSVNTFTTNVNSIAEMIEGLVGLDTSGVDSFVDSVKKIAGTSIDTAKSILENKFSSATNGENSSMKSSGSNAASSIVDGFSSKSGDMSTAAGSLIDSALSGISGHGDAFNAEGLNLITSLAAGITAGAALVTAACTSIGSSALAVLRGNYDSWYGAGRYMAMGFGIGISSYIFEAAARARALANAALNSAKAALQEQSPSKATYKMGEFFGMGFTNALTDYMSTTERTAYTFGTVAKEGLNRAIEESNRLIMSSDISNNPTITPVLDLSQIQDGVGTLGSMLAVDAPIGVNGSFAAIGSTLSSRSTATSGDILTALNALGATLGNKSSGDTYNINGITYDDGSNITEAVRSLIRAARVERRA